MIFHHFIRARARVYVRQGRLVDAESLLQGAEAVYRARDCGRDVLDCLYLRAHIRIHEHRFSEADMLLRQVEVGGPWARELLPGSGPGTPAPDA